jgi:hypothetical protein
LQCSLLIPLAIKSSVAGAWHPTPAPTGDTYQWLKITKYADLSQEKTAWQITWFLIYLKQMADQTVKMTVLRKEKPLERRNAT